MVMLSAKTMMLVMVASTIITYSSTLAKPLTSQEVPDYEEGEIVLDNFEFTIFMPETTITNVDDMTTTPATTVHTPPDLESEFLNAAADGDVKRLEQILSECSNRKDCSTLQTLLFGRDVLGNTALHLAVKSGNEDAVDFLLRHDARLYAPGPNLQTSLHMASADGNTGIVQVLISSKSGTHFPSFLPRRDVFGNTSLALAVYGGHIGVVKILVPRSNRDTLEDAVIAAMKKQNIDILNVLLDHNTYGNSLTFNQALNMVWDDKSTWAILEAKIETDLEDLSLALSVAVRADRVAALRPLIVAGATVTRGLLDMMIRDKQVDMLKELIRVEKNDSSDDVLTEDMRSYLKARIIEAVENCFDDTLAVLLEAGVDVNAVLDGVTPLIAAVRHRDGRYVSLLLQYGADPNLKVRVVDDPGSSKINYYTPLSIADMTGDSEIVLMLINHGANPF